MNVKAIVQMFRVMPSEMLNRSVDQMLDHQLAQAGVTLTDEQRNDLRIGVRAMVRWGLDRPWVFELLWKAMEQRDRN